MRPRASKSIPSAWDSAATWPEPVPRIMRPPESTSRVPSILACTSGFRYGTTTMSLASCTLVVSAAR